MQVATIILSTIFLVTGLSYTGHAQEKISNLTIKSVDSTKYDLYSILAQGKTVVVYIFSTSCSFCAVTTPYIVETHQKYDSLYSGCVTVFGIGAHNNDLLPYREQYGINFVVGDSKDNNEVISLFYSYGSMGYPGCMVIRPDSTLGFLGTGSDQISNQLWFYIDASLVASGGGGVPIETSGRHRFPGSVKIEYSTNQITVRMDGYFSPKYLQCRLFTVHGSEVPLEITYRLLTGEVIELKATPNGTNPGMYFITLSDNKHCMTGKVAIGKAVP
jgi:thiol-disulfide isomerase/thioredoxin